MAKRDRPFKARAWFGPMRFTDDLPGQRSGNVVILRDSEPEPRVAPEAVGARSGLLPFVAGFWLGRK